MTWLTVSPTKTLWPRLRLVAKSRVNLIAGFMLVLLTLIAGWAPGRGEIFAGMDAITQFYPWYSFLGESLRSGDIPGWNPYQFSGAPFAGAPLSGWMYLPAMILFTALPLTAAAKGYLLTHLLLAGLGTYALALALRMNLAGALLAAVAYEFSGYLLSRSICCLAFSGVYAWLPLSLLGAELAIKSRLPLNRGVWWGVGGLGLSQILAAWPGQGAYYALLALGGYVAYRTLLFPPENVQSSVWGRVTGLALHGGAVLLFGFALAAASILPGLEYNALSNLAGGYVGEGSVAPSGGWSLQDWGLLATPGGRYAGLSTLALALAAPFVARARHAVPYFASLALVALTLSGQGPTLLHSILYDFLPGFVRLHPHAPQRITVIFYLAAALMAGATLSALMERGKRATGLAFVPVLAALFLATRMESILSGTLADFVGLRGWGARTLFLLHNADPIPAVSLVLALALGLVAACTGLTARRGGVAALLVAVLFLDLFSATRGLGEGLEVDLSSYYGSREAVGFLRSRASEEPARYFGNDPIAARKGKLHYTTRFANPEAAALLVNNAATLYGVQDIQGYNAVHLARYDEYVEALNGRAQERHLSDVLPGGLDSPLLDLLNVRYIVTPAVTGSAARARPRDLGDGYPTAYSGDRVKVLQNADALPRAWIVHSAKQTTSGKALKLLASGKVDPRRTALLEGPSPDLSKPEDPSADQASVTTYEAGRIRLKTTTGAAGLLVLSEVYYPAWKAYVDGKPVPLHRADYLLRAVPIPAGEHTLELRYESWSLRGGIVASLIAYSALIVLVFTRVRRWWRGMDGIKPTTIPGGS